MSNAAAKIAVALGRFGRAMTLRRRIGTGASFTEAVVSGTARGYRPGELVGSIQQGDMEVTISNAEIAAAAWPGPPKRGDFLVIDGRVWSLQGAETRFLGSEILAHVLHVRGG